MSVEKEIERRIRLRAYKAEEHEGCELVVNFDAVLEEAVHLLQSQEQRLKEREEERLLSEIDMIYQGVNERCDYFASGEEADKFRILLEAMVKGKLWQTCKDDETLCEYTQEVKDKLGEE